MKANLWQKEEFFNKILEEFLCSNLLMFSKLEKTKTPLEGIFCTVFLTRHGRPRGKNRAAGNSIRQ